MAIEVDWHIKLTATVVSWPSKVGGSTNLTDRGVPQRLIKEQQEQEQKQDRTSPFYQTIRG